MRRCSTSTEFALIPGNDADYDIEANWTRVFENNFRHAGRHVPLPEGFSPLSLARVSLTILLRIGFLLVQIGSVPITNINLITLQNIVDFSWISLVWLIGGFAIGYNGDVSGLIGQGHWIGSDPETIDKNGILIGWQAAVVASAISTCFIVGRTHIIGYLVVGTLVSGVLQPFAIHWAWTENGWMTRQHFLGTDVTFRDFAGSTIVHTIGSLTGLIGCLVLGRRILRLREIDDASIPADSAGFALAGHFLVFLGLQSMCFSSPLLTRMTPKVGSMLMVNNLLGGASSSMVVTALHFALGREPFNHWTVMRCVQASIAGTTILASGLNFYTPVVCLGLGFGAGIIHYLVSRVILKSAIEDYCNVVATHLVCSILGTLVSPFGYMGHPGRGRTSAREALAGVAWQFVCLLTVVVLVAVPISVVFRLLECLGLLRNRSEIVNHSRALLALRRGPPRSRAQRLFVPGGETLYLQPCTARVRRHQGDEVVPQLLRRERPAVKFQGSSHHASPSERGKSPNYHSPHETPNSNLSRSAIRVRKLRQIHTLASIDEVSVSGLNENENPIGDDLRYEGNDRQKAFSEDEGKKFHHENGSSMIECSGDFSTASKIGGVSEPPNNSGFHRLQRKSEVAYHDDSPGRDVKKPREPYRLRRTKNSTNLRFESTRPNDRILKFLVEPNTRISSSTESESDDEKTYEIFAKKRSKISGVSDE